MTNLSARKAAIPARISMNPEAYIEKELAGLAAVSTSEKPTDMREEIFRLLMSKKFRKWSVNPEYQEHIRNAIALNVAKHEPIKLTFVFGGYKLWRLEEAPEPDWAELFALMYYAKWLTPICDVYEPGVWFDFYSDDVILELMDNVPKEDTQAYLKTFRQLLDFMRSYVRPNLTFTLNRVGDQYVNEKDFARELETLKAEILKENDGRYPEISPEMRATIEMNVKLIPEQEKDPEWREKVFLLHEAYARVSKRRPYYRMPDKIMLITRQLKNTLAVGTTKTSIAKFWAGVGVLEKRDEGYIERIWSPKQLQEATFTKEPIHVKGLDSKNFTSIRVSTGK